MKKIYFTCAILTLLLTIGLGTYAGNDVNEYSYRYGKDGFSAVSKRDSNEKYFKRGDVKKSGIDVSSWSGDIDWKKVRENGIEFAMIREGYGSADPKQVDRRFHNNIKEAQSNGIPCGVYHYSYADSVNNAIEEAGFCIDNIKNYKLEYPVVFDIEDNSMKKLGRRVLTDICKAFCDRLRQAGYYAAVYTNKNWLKNFLWEDELIGNYDLWYAHWKEMENPEYVCGMWQKINDQKIDGVQYSVDLNICYYDYPKIMKDLHVNGY